MLEFVDSGLHFVQDKNNFIYPDLAGQKSTDPTGTGPDPHPWV